MLGVTGSLAASGDRHLSMGFSGVGAETKSGSCRIKRTSGPPVAALALLCVTQ